MKRTLILLAITLASLTFAPRAHAESGYFGVRLDGFIPIATNTAGGTSFAGFVGVLPLFGIQGGYDFSAPDEAGFSMRGTFRTLFIITELSVDALYRIPDQTGAGVYVGVGGDFVFVLFAGPQTSIFGAHAVLGYNFPSSSLGSFFLEVAPGFLANSTGAFYYVNLGAGFNFRL
jgi:hypothetical protein